jgi:O-antigen ligase
LSYFDAMSQSNNLTRKSARTGDGGAGGSPLVRYLEHVCRVAFGAFIILSAFSIALSQIALGLTMVTGLALWIIKRPRLSLPTRRVLAAAALFVVWMVLASFLGERPWESLGAIREEWLFLIIPLGLLMMTDSAVTHRFVMILAVALLLLGVYGIIQHFTGLYLFKDQKLHTAVDEFRISGGFSHPLTFGNYLVTATLFICAYAVMMFGRVSSWRRWLPIAAGICGLITVALCNSRGPMLSVTVGLVALGLISKRLLYSLGAAVSTLLLFAIVSPSVAGEFGRRVEDDLGADQASSRLYIWRTSIDMALSHPLTGVGPANFGVQYVKHLPPGTEEVSHQGHAHNDFLHIAAISGLPGLIFFIVLWVVVIRQLWRVWRQTDLSPPARALALAALIGSITFLTTSMTEATFTDEEVRQLLMLIWAFGLSAWTQSRARTA